MPPQPTASRLPAVLALLCGALLTLDAAGAPSKRERDEEDDRPQKRKAMRSFDFEADVMDAEMLAPAPAELGGLDADAGVSVGGARDIAPIRAAIEAGGIPSPKLVASSGLLGEYDLPLAATAPCELLLCVRTESTGVELVVDQDTHYLTQLGFSSAIDPTELGRPPLNVVLAFDVSDSMTPHLGLVEEAARTILSQLGPDDQVTVVRFGSEMQVSSTVVGSEALARGLQQPTPMGGSTRLEPALHRAFTEARRRGAGFAGRSRVFLFTDARPNAASVSAGSFVDLARSAARHGVGLTTVGVGPAFGLELALAISGVHGGNLVFLRDRTGVQRRLGAEFDTLVTELAHDLRIEIRPAAGLRVAAVHGVPGEVIERSTEHGREVVRIEVATLFPSRRRGAIYVALAPIGRRDLPRVVGRTNKTIGEVSLTYRELDGRLQLDRGDLVTLAPAQASLGLNRGARLVDELDAMRRVSERMNPQNPERDAQGLRRMLREVARSMASDPELEAEVVLLGQLEENLAQP